MKDLAAEGGRVAAGVHEAKGEWAADEVDVADKINIIQMR